MIGIWLKRADNDAARNGPRAVNPAAHRSAPRARVQESRGGRKGRNSPLPECGAGSAAAIAARPGEGTISLARAGTHGEQAMVVLQVRAWSS